MQQTYVKFTLPRDTYIEANVLREAVAKGLDGQMFNSKPELFNYIHADKTNSSRPKNRFIGGLGWLGFVSESDHLLPSMIIAPAITHLIKQGINAETYIGEKQKSVTITDDPLVYRVTGLADQRDKQREVDSGNAETPDELVKRHILSMFEHAFSEGTILSPIDEEDLNLTVIESRRAGEVIKFRNGGQKSVAKIRATFTMRANLTGIWQAGHLQSRGYGLLYSVNQGGFTQCPI